VGCGLYSSCAEAAESFVDFEPHEHHPNSDAGEIYEQAYRLYRDVYAAAKPVFERHAQT